MYICHFEFSCSGFLHSQDKWEGISKNFLSFFTLFLYIPWVVEASIIFLHLFGTDLLHDATSRRRHINKEHKNNENRICFTLSVAFLLYIHVTIHTFFIHQIINILILLMMKFFEMPALLSCEWGKAEQENSKWHIYFEFFYSVLCWISLFAR